jgi:hypothetical protein
MGRVTILRHDRPIKRFSRPLAMRTRVYPVATVWIASRLDVSKEYSITRWLHRVDAATGWWLNCHGRDRAGTDAVE